MRTIRRADEPYSLKVHCSAPDASYENYREKDDLRISLVNEQRGLCCYCLSRIRPDQASMKIEHWHSQSGYQSDQLNYRNLLASCVGGERGLKANRHCDTSKGDRDLSRNPANPDHHVEQWLRFKGDGTVKSTDPTFDSELNSVLNLNSPSLVRKRKSVLDAFTSQLPRQGTIPPATLRRYLRKWNGDTATGALQPFCQVVIFWLQQKL